MIKKERLEELIEQGATIFSTHADYKEIKLNNDFKVEEVWCLGDCLVSKSLVFSLFGISLIFLFETKEDAEEYAEFDNITKTERLKLPTWSDIFPDKENHFYDGTYNCWWDDCCKYDIYINAFITDNNFEKGYFDINGHREFGITKESYTNIRRYAVKLFYGEEV